MTVFENTEKQLCLIVTINSSLDKTYKKDPSFVTSTLVHESIHVWQLILERIKEVSKPSHEIEAYSIQNIYQQLFQAYLDTRINKKK